MLKERLSILFRTAQENSFTRKNGIRVSKFVNLDMEEYRDLATATSHLTGKPASRFTHVHQNMEDLIKKIKLLRVLGQKTGTCFQRCVGLDGINAVYSTAFEIDRDHKTDYFERFKKWLTYIQDENLMVVGAMTDPKGDRAKGPADQHDPDHRARIHRTGDRSRL